jgi:hypothetical protein
MRFVSALQHSKCREFESSAQRRYWMARDGYLFSVALDRGDRSSEPVARRVPLQAGIGDR